MGIKWKFIEYQMNYPDLINGSFECLAGFFVLLHCKKVINDKQVKGVSILATVFFTSWGFWNLYYYPHLNQILSFIGGLFIVSANCLWVTLMIYYSRKNYEKNKNSL